MSSLAKLWQQALMPADASIGEAIRCLDKVGIKIILVINACGVLEGTISDGDVRRGLLKGLTLDSSISSIIHKNAFVVPPDMGRDLVLQIMAANKIQQIPVVDKDHRPIGLHLWDEIATPPLRSSPVVIMAGGLGTRLLPHTENCPKPLLLVAGKPMLQHIIECARLEGFNHFIISINYLGELIEEFFGDGSFLGVHIEYLREKAPLGTAGALSLLRPLPKVPFIVTNGDVISDIRYGDILDFHVRHSAKATMAVRVHEWQNPFGVVETRGIEIIGFEEKPIARSHINAGVYVLEPDALNLLEHNENCNMPTLFERIKLEEMKTVAYPMHEPWLDVGRPDDLQKAQLFI